MGSGHNEGSHVTLGRWRGIIGSKISQTVPNIVPTKPNYPADGRIYGRRVGVKLFVEEVIV